MNPLTEFTGENARKYMEEDRFHHAKWFSLVPSMEGLLSKSLGERDFIDIGCGYGAISRRLIGQRACRIYALDASGDMVRIAASLNLDNLDRIYHHVGRIETIPEIRFPKFRFGMATFTDAIAMLVLNYLDTPEALQSAFKRIASTLESNGQLTSFNNSLSDSGIENATWSGPDFEVNYERGRERNGSTEYKVTRKSKSGEVELMINDWSQEAYESALKNAGFNHVEWHNPIISQWGADKFPRQFWADYIRLGLFKGFVARKTG